MGEEPTTNRLQFESTPEVEVPLGETAFYVTKSNFYRVVHADGVFGGGTPTPGNIMMTFFNHRVAFPEKMVRDFNGNEVLSKREMKFGMEQEFEVSIVMNLDTAKIMLAWLTETIKNTETALQLNRGK
jgi:hypothetical protein